ncbi:MAG: sigma-70 family RNA polymerase sigma factor [Aquamicrobium sp.]|uniref:RNA polymerase sigma factor n=1 Tax=Aquamicrobium sp. TaxID=1872579 RepID=UPI00349ED583|nr:sigma-70 family RNA polymerase sigma factor [Aquamicrobium sp.]MCO5158586.1 sigma-70 family RNA polymerase sigma factor [Aquamicrobium sp.]
MSWDIHTLFRRHARDIVQSLRRRGISEETAADLTQDTFVRVLTSPPATNASSHNPAGYLFRVARNLGIDHQRRERLLVRVDLAPEDFAAIADPSPSPEAITYDRQRLALTQAALAELPERTRRAFELHRMDEMTIAAVAAELGLSVSRVWTLIRTAYEHVDARLTDGS